MHTPRALAAALWLFTSAPLAAQHDLAGTLEILQSDSLADPELRESSGVARSLIHPGIYYSINDSGRGPTVFALDSTGAARGRWELPSLENRDWEALATGPCPSGECLFIGDLGDNRERRKHVTIYRLAEPRTLGPFQGGGTAPPPSLDSVRFRYPEGPRDVEAMWVDPAGVPQVVTKGRSGRIVHYRVPPRFESKRVQTAERVAVLPITPEPATGQWVTDAALAPGGKQVAVRTYAMLYVFPLDAEGRLGSPRRCGLAGLEPQGEGVAWMDDERLLLTSEARKGAAAPVHVVRCRAR